MSITSCQPSASSCSSGVGIPTPAALIARSSPPHASHAPPTAAATASGSATSVGSASAELSGLFKSGSYGWTFAPQAVLPILDYGRNTAILGSARAQGDIAVAQYERSIQTAFREVADTLDAKATYDDQIQATEDLVKASQRNLELSDLRYQNGIESLLQLVDAQRTLFTAEQSLLQARLQRLNNLVQLYKSLGGGWSETTAAPAPPPVSQLR